MQRWLPLPTTPDLSALPLDPARSASLARSRRRAHAAHVLWLDGQLTESLRLASDAFRDVADALGPPPAEASAAGVDPEAPSSGLSRPPSDLAAPSSDLAAASESPGSASSHQDTVSGDLVRPSSDPSGAPEASSGEPSLRSRIASTLADLDRIAPPEDDRTYSSLHAALYERLVDVRALADRACERHLPPTARPRRPWKPALVVLAVLGVSAVAAFASHHRVRVVASDQYSPQFSAENVTDGLGETEWLLPNGQNGWLEVVLPSRQRVTAVSVRNAHNRHYNDRATKAFRVEAFRGAEPVASAAGTFASIAPEGAPQTVGLVAPEADRIRVSVLSFHGSGGGLAEIDVR